MIFPLRVFGRLAWNSISFGATAEPSFLASEAEQFHAQGLARLVADLQRDEGFHQFADDRVRLADYPSLGDRRMLKQRALDLERPNHMAGGLDDVVCASDEPKVAIRVAPREVAGDIPNHLRSIFCSVPRRGGSRGTSTAIRASTPGRLQRPAP